MFMTEMSNLSLAMLFFFFLLDEESPPPWTLRKIDY